MPVGWGSRRLQAWERRREPLTFAGANAIRTAHKILAGLIEVFHENDVSRPISQALFLARRTFVGQALGMYSR
jgi:hypothetical protein